MNYSVKLYLFWGILLSIPLSCFCQKCQIKGLVLSENQHAIEYANIILLSNDSAYVAGTISDSLGIWKISTIPGTYVLQISSMGYKNIYKSLSLSNSINIGEVYLEVANVQLDNITVVSAKPLVKREMDRLVFDAGNLTIAGNNALDILKNVPGLMITDDQLTIIGKGEVRVMINEKELKLNGKDLLSFLKTYQAHDLDKVEVITEPPAKYAAEGNAGILNITLKKLENNYAGGSLSYIHNYANYNTDEVNGMLNYNKDKITAFINTGTGFGKYSYLESNIQHYTLLKRHSHTEAVNKVKYGSIRGGLDYLLKKNLNIGIQALYNVSKPNEKITNETLMFSDKPEIIDSLLRSKNQKRKSAKKYALNLHVDIKLDSVGKAIKFNIDYFNSSSTSEEFFNSSNYNQKNEELLHSKFNFDNDASFKLQTTSSSLDISLPFTKSALNIGVNTFFTRTANKINYYNQTFSENKNNDFVYTENITAIYGDFTKTINKFLKMNLGLRVEHTLTKGDSRQTKEFNKESYVNFFPVFFLGFNPNKDNAFNFSLSSRISRPGFRNVNPFILYINRYNVVCGKSDLKPSITYKTNIGYTFKNNFSIDLYYSYAKDVFTQVTNMDSLTNTSKTEWDNALTVHNIGITNSYLFNKLSWLQSFIIQGFYYEKSMSYSKYTIPTQNNFVYILSMNNRFYLNKNKTFIGQLSGSFTSKQRKAISTLNPYYDLNAGLQYKLLNNKLILGINISNLIVSDVSGEVNSNGMNMEFKNKYSYRTYSISINYIFGAKMSRKQNQYSSKDIQNRL